MPVIWAVVALVVASVGSLFFSTLTYSLRDLSRTRLADYFEKHHRPHLLSAILDHEDDHVFVTAVLRLLANTLIVLASVWICQGTIVNMVVRDIAVFALASVVTLFFSVALPQALNEYAGDIWVGASARFLCLLRAAFTPVLWVMHATERFVRSAAGASPAPEPEQIEQQVEEDILSAVEEGAEAGVVDPQEQKMIESVIELHDSTAGRIMTARTEIVALSLKATLAQVKQAIESSGHSRIPVHEGNLDRIIGILHARDLLKHLGQPVEKFEIRSAIRPALFVPETTPLGDLLRDFRRRGVHMAIVLDEYGATTGLVTLEDIFRELVGPVSHENTTVEPAVFRRIDEHTAEADARIDVEELNRLTGLNLPEDEGYATFGGFILASLGRIPEPGAEFEQDGVRYKILEAEPQRVKRVRIEQIPQSVETEGVGRTE
jgi:CBS domain containing-hemolysin-like protein